MNNPRNNSASFNRRSFVKNGLVAAGAVTVGTGLLTSAEPLFAKQNSERGPEERGGRLTKGDAAILRFLAAADRRTPSMGKSHLPG